MKFRNVLIVGILFLALTSYVLFFERHSKTTEELQQKDLSVLHLRTSDVTGLLLESGETSIALEKKGAAWSMTKPFATEGDLDNVSAFLSELELLRADRLVTADAKEKLDWKQYGLAGSSQKIRIKTTFSQRVLVLGKATPMGKTVYIAVEGQPMVCVVSGDAQKLFHKVPEDFRNHVALEFNIDDVVALAVKNPAGLFEVEQQKGRAGDSASSWKWKKAPKDKQLDQEAYSSMLWELRRLKFKQYVGERNQQAEAWSHPTIKISVWLKREKAPRTLLVGSILPDGSALAAIEGKTGIFTIEAYQVESLKKNLAKPLEVPLPPVSHNGPAKPAFTAAKVTQPT